MRRLIAIALPVILVGAALGAWLLLKPAPPAPVPESRTVAPAPVAPAPTITPAPATPAPEPLRRAAPKPAAEPTAAPPAPVEAAPTTATLRVEADVDATVYIDKIGIGPAPISIPNLAPGEHRLNVSAPGYEGYADTITLEPGERTISVKFKEVRLDVKTAAVHKHGMGSCRGELSATPQGLTYTAADGKDSFTVVLTDLTGFDFDYLAKNLRIRTRQGKTLNFTDPDGNADRMFAFHRDVDKARKRLIAGQ